MTKSLSIFTNLVGFGAKIEEKNRIAKNVVKNQLMGVRFRGGGSGPKLPKRTKSIIPEFFFFDVAPNTSKLLPSISDKITFIDDHNY